MQRAYRIYSRFAAGLFILIALYTMPTKLLQGRLEADWFHSSLHLASALLGAYAGWVAVSAVPARVFTWGVGAIYLALAIYGAFSPRLFLGTPFAIPLTVADNIFHLILAVPALIIALVDVALSWHPLRLSGQR